MSEQTLRAFIQATYQRLWSLAPAFKKQGNKEASVMLASLEIPTLPDAVGLLTVSVSEEPAGEIGAVAVAFADRLRLAAGILAENGSLEAARLRAEADEIKEAFAGRELADDVFRAAVGLGHVLRGRQAPGSLHQFRDSTPDRPRAQQNVWESLEAVRRWLDLPHCPYNELDKGLADRGGPRWRRAALVKVAQAYALTNSRAEGADGQALALLGQALWARLDAGPDGCLESLVKVAWPERPATTA